MSHRSFTDCMIYTNLDTFIPSTKRIIKKLYDHFLWMRFICLKVTEPLRGDSLLSTIQFPGVPGTQLINLGKMKG